MGVENLDLLFQTNVKRFLVTTSSNDEGLPIFTSSEAREIGGILNFSVLGTPSVVNTNKGKPKERNRRFVFTVEMLQAGLDTITLFDDTYYDKPIHIGIEGSDNQFYITTGSGLHYRRELEYNLASEGDSVFRILLDFVGQQGKDALLTPDAANGIVGPTDPTKLIQLSEEFHGPLCEASYSQQSGSNYTGSGEITPEDSIISWTGEAVEASCGQMIEKNGRGRIQNRFLQTGTASLDEIEDVYRANDAFWDIKFKDSNGTLQTISSAASGGMTLIIEDNRVFNQDTTEPQTILVWGETVTKKILDFINIPT